MAVEQNLQESYGGPEFDQAANGRLSLMDLIGTAERWADEPRSDKIIALYRVWLANSDSPLAYAANFNLGSLLSASKDFAGAERAYRQSLAQNPQFPQSMVNLGTALEQQGKIEEALNQWRAVIKTVDPNKGDGRTYYLHALNNLGRLLEIQKQFEEAEDMLTRSLLEDPDQPNVITHWVHLRQKQCKWPVYAPLKGIPIEKMIEHTSSLAMLSASGDPQMQLDAAKSFVKAKVKLDVPHLTNKEGYRHDKLRVGYLSSDFCAHAVSILTAELYELHDRSKIDVYGFCWSREDGTPMRARVVNALDNYIRIGEMTDAEAAECIRSHEIDILVDLQGQTSGARPNILSYRPAPMMVTYLGFPGPTALPDIDYVIADSFVFPEELKPYFTEKPLYMPSCFQINDRQRGIGPKPTRASCNLPEDAFVFCSFNNNFKFTLEVFTIWMNILKAVPKSVLWLVSDHDIVRTNLWAEAEKQGVDRARVIFAERVQPEQYIARYQAADLFLDTLTFNAGTTASDALWAGLPLLTCPGRTFSSRMAGSILRAVDLPQLIANDTDDYQARAIALANDRPQIEAMKKQLVDNRLSCTLFDTPKFVRDLEALFEKIALKGSASAHTDKKTSKKPVGKTTQKRVAAPTLVPRVSILMPTHNQPEQLDIALKSALAQKYTNLEIIISDTSEDDTTERQLAALIKADARVRYSRSRKMSVSAHRTHCLALSSGDFVNFLLNDDVFDGEKIAQMSGYLMQQPNAGMITSFQSMVDADGRVQQIPGSAPIFATQTVVGGISLGDLMLGNANNILGAPSAILFRREHMTENYGMFAGQRYDALADVATWLSILSSKDCVYLPQALSSFQLSTELAARAHAASIEANVEWLQLYCAAHLKNKFMFNSPVFYAQLTTKLTGTISYLASVREDIKAGAFNIETLHQLIRQATTILLTK